MSDFTLSTGTIDTSGTAGKAHGKIEASSQVFVEARRQALEDAKKALDPEDDSVPESAVILPQAEPEGIRTVAKARIDAALEDLEAGVIFDDTSDDEFGIFGSSETREDDDDAQLRRQLDEAGIETDQVATSLVGTLDTTGTAGNTFSAADVAPEGIFGTDAPAPRLRGVTEDDTDNPAAQTKEQKDEEEPTETVVSDGGETVEEKPLTSDETTTEPPAEPGTVDTTGTSGESEGEQAQQQGDDYESWSAKKRQAELVKRKLPKTGSKEQQVTRLREDDASKADS